MDPGNGAARMNPYQALMQRAWTADLPMSAMLELTYRCNLDCLFCYNDRPREQHGQALSLDQYLALLDGLRRLGVMNLSLSGGEPLAHPDFFVIGAAARKRRFAVRVKSNGHALNHRLARRLREEVDPFQVEISLHGAKAATHERQTRVVGSFRRLEHNLDVLAELGLRVRLNATLTRWNEDELEDLYAFADRRGLPLTVYPQVSPRDDGDRSVLSLTASAEGLRRHYRLLARRQGATSVRVAFGDDGESGCAGTEAAGGGADAAPAKFCGSGSSTLLVDPVGDVLPCVQWRRPLGNLHQQDIETIWHESTERQWIRRQTALVAGDMQAHGSAGAAAGFCPGLAESAGGSHRQADHQTRKRIDVLQELAAADG